MNKDLVSLMHAHRGHYIEGVVRGLTRSRSSRYKELPESELRQRASKLVDALLASMVAGPGRFISHVRLMAEERFCEGFGLFELHRAIRLLEELVWKDVVQECPPEAHALNLSRVAGTIGAARDQLSLLYLSLAEASRHPGQDRRRRMLDLFKGTDPAPLFQDQEDLSGEDPGASSGQLPDRGALELKTRAPPR